jgi:4a-hydroxytetrahydrobiopterin dehydratase
MRVECSPRFCKFGEVVRFEPQGDELAKTEGRHPDISFDDGMPWSRGEPRRSRDLYENDFMMATRIGDHGSSLGTATEDLYRTDIHGVMWK